VLELMTGLSRSAPRSTSGQHLDAASRRSHQAEKETMKENQK
jgi:hypothetical protein